MHVCMGAPMLPAAAERARVGCARTLARPIVTGPCSQHACALTSKSACIALEPHASTRMGRPCMPCTMYPDTPALVHARSLPLRAQTAQEWAALGEHASAARALALAEPWVAVFEEVACEPGTPHAKRTQYAVMVRAAPHPVGGPRGSALCHLTCVPQGLQRNHAAACTAGPLRHAIASKLHGGVGRCHVHVPVPTTPPPRFPRPC